jgi:RNA polymerase sigma-70 factor (ECF subfamily)
MGANAAEYSKVKNSAAERAELDKLFGEARPKLHRYCARMTGSVVDGEDVVQEAFLKAIEASARIESPTNPEAWLFRIAHNAALDFLRRRSRHEVAHPDEDLEVFAAPVDTMRDREIAAVSLRTFMRLPAGLRCTIILKDVLGYSLQEVCEVTGGSIPSVKSSLQRGRMRLRELAREPDDITPPAMTDLERIRLTAYVDRFNARDFEAVRNMLAEDVRLDLVNRVQRRGRAEVSEYFHRYSLRSDWQCVTGFIDRRPAILVFDLHDPRGQPTSFILLDWEDGSVLSIRDFLFARYAMDGAELVALS